LKEKNVNRRMFCLGIAAIALAAAGLPAAEKAGPEGGIRILLTTGGHAFEEDAFYAMFDAMRGIEYTKAELPKDAGLLKPGLEKQFDCIVMYDMCKPAISPEQRKAFVELLTTGGIGLVSMHHNLGAQWDWDEYRKIIGGRVILEPTVIDGKAWTVTPWAHGQRLNVKIANREHPITKGVGDFEIEDEIYGKFWVDPRAEVLLTTDHSENNPEVAWTKTYGKSRVFHLMLGHDGKAYANPAYRKLLEQGIRWAAGR